MAARHGRLQTAECVRRGHAVAFGPAPRPDANDFATRAKLECPKEQQRHDRSQIIVLATPVFLLLIALEFASGWPAAATPIG